jgi:hypothetical protein
MADNDTAALVVALSAQLTRFEKDMKGAVDIADRNVKAIETRFTQLNGVVTGKLQQVTASLSSNLGFTGQLLSALGPAGVVAAVGIGAAVGVMYSLVSATEQFSIKAKALKEGAETVGLSITQLKLLGQSGAKVGLDFDETAAFFTKYIANVEALRKGGGPLYDALLKIDVGLLRQLAATKDSAEAIDILVLAYKRLQDQSARLDLARAAGGRAGLSGGRLLDSLGNQGGLSGLEQNSPKIDEGQIERAAQLRTDIDAISRKTANIWGGMFSDAILSHQKSAVQELQDISLWLSRIIDSIRGLPPAGLRITVNKPAEAAPAATFNERFGSSGGPPPVVAAVELEILQRHNALLGEAVTQGEQWRQKKLEIAAAAEKDPTVNGVANRALAAFNLTMRAAALATRERLGVATEDGIVQIRLAQLAQDRVKFSLSDNEVQKATVIILREAKQAAEALEVRAAYLPGLKQLELDARNARRGLDELAVSSLNNVETGLTDLVTGTKTAAEAFRSMANSIIQDLVRMSIRRSITGPLAGMLGGFFGGGPQTTSFGPQLSGVPMNAAGTDNWRGGLTSINERGPEIVDLPQGTRIIPNEIARTMKAGGGDTYSLSAPITIQGDASAKTARMIADAVEGVVKRMPQLVRGANNFNAVHSRR